MSFRIAHAERGMTLIEIIVVILILAILLAVALPMFIGQQDKAKSSDVKVQLTGLEHAAKGIWTNNDQTLPAIGPLVSGLQGSAAGGISVVAGTSYAADTVNVERNGNDSVTLRGLSDDGNKYMLRSTYDGPGGGIYKTYGEDTTPIVNLAPNPSFELSSISPWSANGGATIAATNARNSFGRQSASIAVANGFQGIILSGADRVPVVAGTTYTTGFYATNSKDDVGEDVCLSLAYMNAGGGSLASPPQKCAAVGNGWERISLTSTAPASAASAQVFISHGGTAGTFYLDAVSFTSGASLRPYFDGNFGGGSWVPGPDNRTASNAPSWEGW